MGFPSETPVILRRVIDLPVLPREPACPAALTVAGASGAQQGVVCREMLQDIEHEAGLRMTPRALEVMREQDSGIYLNLKSDPSTVVAFCHGHAVPVLTEDGPAKASFTACPVWQTARDRHLAGKAGLSDPEPQPESVSYGVNSLDADDPWAQARQDLDLLTAGG